MDNAGFLHLVFGVILRENDCTQLLFSENRKLFTLKRFIRLRQISEQDINALILLFRNNEHSDRAVIREIPLDPGAVLFHRVGAVADTGIYRILYHEIPVIQKKIPKARRFPPLLFARHGKIKKHQYSHQLIHSCAAAVPIIPGGSNGLLREKENGKDSGQAVRSHRQHCGAARRKEYPDSGS